MPGAHRNGDSRYCGATTTVPGQSTVFVNGELWAVDGATDDHTNGGALTPSGTTIFIGGALVCCKNDVGALDVLAGIIHPTAWPTASGCSSDVLCYDGSAGGALDTEDEDTFPDFIVPIEGE